MVDMATTTHGSCDNALTALAENVRAASSLVHETFTLRNVRRFQHRVANINAATHDIRRFTTHVEKDWHVYTEDEKRMLYEMALYAARQDASEAPTGPDSSWSSSCQALLIRLFMARAVQVVDEAEAALFWFADEVFAHVEDEAPEIQDMIASRLASARSEAVNHELDRMVG